MYQIVCMLEIKRRVVILLPVYNDWTSAKVLIGRLELIFQDILVDLTPNYLIVNDCSTDIYEINVKGVEILSLNRNVGHQKAIGIGLSFIYENISCDLVVVMDSDGEDVPEHVPELIERHLQTGDNHIIFAKRGKRSEKFIFRAFYVIYKSLFQILTGKEISFGNYSLIPAKSLARLVHVPDVWNHFSGGIIKSKLPYTTVILDRGVRYAGKSTMNFNSLILHGLSSLSVHLDIISIRVIIFSLVLFALTVVGIVGLLIVKIFTEYAIPGWTSTISLVLILFLTQILTFSFLLIFMYLNFKNQKDFNPLEHYKQFI